MAARSSIMVSTIRRILAKGRIAIPLVRSASGDMGLESRAVRGYTRPS
jgi:hypothetical protein